MFGDPTIRRRTFLEISGRSVGCAMVAGFILGQRRAEGTEAPAGSTARPSVNPTTANDLIRVGLIGCGGMGTRHLEALCNNKQCEVASVCDVYLPRCEAAVKLVADATGKRPDSYQDFRRVLDRDDIDAIFLATPDHWHPLMTILGCQAWKDVYVEKPVCTTIEEGRAMVKAARRYGRVVQVGTQQRSMPLFKQAMTIIHNGTLGPVTTASAWVGVNFVDIRETPQPVPEGLDWDLWLGPAPDVPFSPQRFGNFRSFYDYARGGELTNWGVHLVDVVHWGIGQDRPLSVQALGGSYLRGPGADNYETIEALLEYPGCSVTWEQRHANAHANKGYGMKFHGPKGRLTMDRNTFVVEPAELGVGEVIGEPERSWAHPEHHNDFFECMRTRGRPAADIEIGVRSTAAVLLAGIALKTRRRLVWDGDAERFIGDEAANRHLTRPYRAPWHL